MLALLASLPVAGLIVVTLEVGVRILKPEINVQGTDRSLFVEDAFGTSPGWKPNASGVSFGAEVTIDNRGFRMMDPPPNPSATWLIFGDSITFGVGVLAERTFIGLLQQALPETEIINTSVIGYSTENYKDVAQSFARRNVAIDRALLFYALNDTHGAFGLAKARGIRGKLRAFLRRSSKLYMLAKHMLLDRSRWHFRHDYDRYQDDNPYFQRAVSDLEHISTRLRERDIPLTVVLLFPEYQLRTKEAQYLLPQQLLRRRLENLEIPYIDLFEHFEDGGEDSRSFYLYTDSMHYSNLGHERVFEVLRERLSD